MRTAGFWISAPSPVTKLQGLGSHMGGRSTGSASGMLKPPMMFTIRTPSSGAPSTTSSRAKDWPLRRQSPKTSPTST